MNGVKVPSCSPQTRLPIEATLVSAMRTGIGIGLLTESYALGYLDEPTFANRSGQALAAVSREELNALTVDLSVDEAATDHSRRQALARRLVETGPPVAATGLMVIATFVFTQILLNGSISAWLGLIVFGLVNMWVGSKVSSQRSGASTDHGKAKE